MKKIAEAWRSLYIDPELQSRFALTLVVLIAAESAFVSRGFSRLFLIARDWQRPSLLWDFFWALFWLLAPLVGVNTWIGLYWSLKIARPLRNLDRGLMELREGRFSPGIDFKSGDALKSLVLNFNRTSGELKLLLFRDHQLVQEAVRDLEKCASARGEELQALILGARSKLSVVGAHFFKSLSQ